MLEDVGLVQSCGVGLISTPDLHPYFVCVAFLEEVFVRPTWSGASLTCTPDLHPDFVCGALLEEGFIKPEDVARNNTPNRIRKFFGPLFSSIGLVNFQPNVVGNVTLRFSNRSTLRTQFLVGVVQMGI